MRELGNKLLLFAFCFLLLPYTDITLTVVTAVLCATILTCIAACCRNRWVFFGMLCLYCMLTWLFPVFSLFFPVLVYDAATRELSFWPSFLLLTVTFLSVLRFESGFTIVGILIFSAAAIWLQSCSRTIRHLLAEFHQYRDDSTESAMLLREKNNALIQKQDYDIHVATLQERNRIAREIHDNVGHLLTRSLLQTGAIQVINTEESLKQPLSELNATLNTAMTSIRNSVHDLHDESIHLEYALKDILASVPALTSVLEYDASPEIPRAVKYSFIAIAKEAVTNTERHSDADHIRISVREHPGFWQFCIEDNGTVFSPGQTEGIGIRNMQKRIQDLGGTFRISTENGFHIFISVLKNLGGDNNESMHRR